MEPLLEMLDVGKAYPAGDGSVAVLKGVTLSIAAGEMVAVVGPSGSGKSTLMNILGCMDRPTNGTYRISGRATGNLDADELATLRRVHFGFVFQRYHLLPDLTALGNVEIPAIYANQARKSRRDRAARLLGRLGLGNRLDHRPGQLSGGQQQRVSIARALMNGGLVILADEPTGALDRQSGQDMLKVLAEMHAAGHTVIIVTHDMQVAGHADRVIRIEDGAIVSDQTVRVSAPSCEQGRDFPPDAEGLAWQGGWDRFREAARMALLAMASHRLRTFLTMLGIIIGIASVVSVVALGEGSRQRVLSDISSIGTNTIDIFPGSDFGDEKAQSIHTLTPADADALARQDYVDSVTPRVSGTATLRWRNVSVSASINGVGERYFRVHGYEMASGHPFDGQSTRSLAQEAVIDDNTRKKLSGQESHVVGEVILLGNVPCRVIGVTKKKQTPFGNGDSLNVWIPYTTAMSRLLGQTHLKGITVRVSDGTSTEAAENSIRALLAQRHARQDFFVMNTDTIRQTIEKTTSTLTLLISAIALISLIVGGIGVMNIMLVSVTERTTEIGVRMAVGARRGDILRQFLVESVLVCLVGGILGIGLALLSGIALATLGASMIYSTTSIIVAFSCSTLIGVVFGYLPARNAARLDPVEALARE